MRFKDGSYKIIKAAEDLKDNLTKYTDFRDFSMDIHGPASDRNSETGLNGLRNMNIYRNSSSQGKSR